MSDMSDLLADRPWLSAYSPGVAADIDPSQYSSLVQLMEEAFLKYADRPAYSFMGGIYSVRRVQEELAPQLLARLLAEHVDAVLFVPV